VRDLLVGARGHLARDATLAVVEGADVGMSRTAPHAAALNALR
jgi:hypothetical protein